MQTVSPPKHFGIVESGVYRCAYPRTLAQANYLRSLRPQTFIQLSIEGIPRAVRRVLEQPYAPSPFDNNFGSAEKRIQCTFRPSAPLSEEEKEGSNRLSQPPPSSNSEVAAVSTTASAASAKKGVLTFQSPPPLPPPAAAAATAAEEDSSKVKTPPPSLPSSIPMIEVDNPHSLTVINTIRPLNQPILVDLSPMGWARGASFSADMVLQALDYIFDASCYPIVLFGATGETEVSAVVSGLRIVQHWSFSAIVGEATLYSASGQPSRPLVAFIESLTALPLKREDYLPLAMQERRNYIARAILGALRSEEVMVQRSLRRQQAYAAARSGWQRQRREERSRVKQQQMRDAQLKRQQQNQRQQQQQQQRQASASSIGSLSAADQAEGPSQGVGVGGEEGGGGGGSSHSLVHNNVKDGGAGNSPLPEGASNNTTNAVNATAGRPSLGGGGGAPLSSPNSVGNFAFPSSETETPKTAANIGLVNTDSSDDEGAAGDGRAAGDAEAELLALLDPAADEDDGDEVSENQRRADGCGPSSSNGGEGASIIIGGVGGSLVEGGGEGVGGSRPIGGSQFMLAALDECLAAARRRSCAAILACSAATAANAAGTTTFADGTYSSSSAAALLTMKDDKNRRCLNIVDALFSPSSSSFDTFTAGADEHQRGDWLGLGFGAGGGRGGNGCGGYLSETLVLGGLGTTGMVGGACGETQGAGGKEGGGGGGGGSVNKSGVVSGTPSNTTTPSAAGPLSSPPLSHCGLRTLTAQLGYTHIPSLPSSGANNGLTTSSSRAPTAAVSSDAAATPPPPLSATSSTTAAAILAFDATSASAVFTASFAAPTAALSPLALLAALPKAVVCPLWWADMIRLHEEEEGLMRKVTIERVPMASLKGREDAPPIELIRFDRNPPALGPKSKFGKVSVAEEEDA